MNVYEIIIIISIILLIISCLCCLITHIPKKKNYTINSFFEETSLRGPVWGPRTYRKYNTINDISLKYIDKIDNEDYYVTWRYSGEDLLHNATYNLILLPYKNAQNNFQIHFEDHLYLKKFYEKYNLYNDFLKDQLKEIVFLTNDYNINKEQYLELEKYQSDNIYIIKASLWSKKGPYSYLHIDEKNKLYFDEGINQNIAKFLLE